MKQFFLVIVVFLAACSSAQKDGKIETNNVVDSYDTSITKMLSLPVLEKGYRFGNEITYSFEGNELNRGDVKSYRRLHWSGNDIAFSKGAKLTVLLPQKFQNHFIENLPKLISVNHSNGFGILKQVHDSVLVLFVKSSIRSGMYQGFQVSSYKMTTGELIDVESIGITGSFENYSHYCQFDVIKNNQIRAYNFSHYESIDWGLITDVEVGSDGKFRFSRVAKYFNGYDVPDKNTELENQKFITVFSKY